MIWLILAWLALSASDAYITHRVVEKFGLESELNGVIRWLAGKLGALPGIVLGIGVPAVLFAVVLHASPVLLAMLVGARLFLLGTQLRAHWRLLLGR